MSAPYELMALLRQHGVEFRYELPDEGGEIHCAPDGTIDVSPIGSMEQ